MAAAEWTYDISVTEIREIEPNLVAVIGEVRSDGNALSPWTVVVRVRSGLIVESRSYLSSRDLLDDLGLLGEAPSDEQASRNGASVRSGKPPAGP